MKGGGTVRGGRRYVLSLLEKGPNQGPVLSFRRIDERRRIDGHGGQQRREKTQ
jgi:hypothetical protein